MLKKLWLLLAIVIILSACSEKPKPEDRFAEYVALWNDQKFGTMYEKLSTETKEKVDLEEFSKRYKNIYDGVQASNIKISFKKPKEEIDTKDKEKIVLPYRVSMDTVAGKIEYTHEAMLVKEEIEKGYDWFIKWDTSHIFPQLKEGQEVKVSQTEPVRGEIFDRNGNPLAQNGKVYEVGIEPGKLGEERSTTLTALAIIYSFQYRKLKQN